MCSPKTMLKIGVVIGAPLAIGYITFPQFRATIASIAPLALFALCPLGMLLGMKGMMGDKQGGCTSCGHNHATETKHIQDKIKE